MSGDGFTVKEVVVSIERDVLALTGKLDAYIAIHQSQHVAETMADAAARSSPKGSAAGQALLDDIEAIAGDGREIRAIVMVHERTIQRLFGATALASFLGLGAVVLVILRMVAGA